MGYRGLRRLLTLFAICCLLGAVGVMSINLLPLAEPVAFNDRDRGRNVPKSNAKDRESVDVGQVSSDAFELVWNKKLHRPLVDPPAVDVEESMVAEELPDQTTPVAIRLIGTLIESQRERRQAWIQVEGSTVRMVKEGDHLNDVPELTEIVTIENREIVLRQSGVESVLRIEKRDFPVFGPMPEESRE